MTRITRRDFVKDTAAIAGASLLVPLGGQLGEALQAAPAIPRRPFGKTGVEVTMIGLGGGSRFYEPIPDDEVGAELVRKTIDRGVQFIETAANYGPKDESERRIGMAMKTHRSKVFLETKVDARDYDGAMKEIERSLTFLQTDHVDLMLHHNVGRLQHVEQIASADGAERAIRKMVDQKVVRFRGFSTHFPDLALKMIEQLEPDAMQLIINATRVPDYEAEVLPMARQKGIAVVVMKSVGKGYFLRHNFTKPDRIDEYGPSPEVFDRKDLPTAKDYLWYALTLPVSTVVVGMDSERTLDAVIQDVQGFRPLSAAQMQSVSERAQVFRTTGFWVPNAQPRA